MRAKTHQNSQRMTADERLLLALAEQIKLPLLQVARRAELARLKHDISMVEDIELTADSALRLIDNYLLSTKLSRVHDSLQLEPVSIAAVLDQTAHELTKLADQYECDLEVHLSGRYAPIMAHRTGLEAAMTSLGYVFVEAQGSQSHKQRPMIKLAAHRSKNGIVAGMFADLEGLSSDMYQRARGLYGHVSQPLTQLVSSSGAGVFVADSLLHAMSTRLRLAHHQKLSGLAATFTPSNQLSLVK